LLSEWGLVPNHANPMKQCKICDRIEYFECAISRRYLSEIRDALPIAELETAIVRGDFAERLAAIGAAH
jgi:hypothetical protein